MPPTPLERDISSQTNPAEESANVTGAVAPEID